MNIYVVQFSNYHPPEIDSIHGTKASANTRALELGDKWRVEVWELRGANDRIAELEAEQAKLVRAFFAFVHLARAIPLPEEDAAKP